MTYARHHISSNSQTTPRSLSYYTSFIFSSVVHLQYLSEYRSVALLSDTLRGTGAEAHVAALPIAMLQHTKWSFSAQYPQEMFNVLLVLNETKHPLCSKAFRPAPQMPAKVSRLCRALIDVPSSNFHKERDVSLPRVHYEGSSPSPMRRRGLITSPFYLHSRFETLSSNAALRPRLIAPSTPYFHLAQKSSRRENLPSVRW